MKSSSRCVRTTAVRTQRHEDDDNDNGMYTYYYDIMRVRNYTNQTVDVVYAFY